MLYRLACLVALMLAVSSVSSAMAKRHPAQRTITPRIAVHYYRAKPAHRTFTQADPLVCEAPA
jgi:hypothetical protein